MAVAMAPACIHAVDDDPHYLESIVAWLSPHGYTVTTFSSADAFLSALPGLEPGCVLMDLGMVPLDGCAALLVMRDYPIDWPVIMLSETAAADIADLCMLAGADLHLAKSGDPAHLLCAVERLARDFAAACAAATIASLSYAQPVDPQAWRAHKDALCARFLQHLAPARGDGDAGSNPAVGKSRR
ncbi:response regulator [Sphingosinicella sp. BN140058]|uniref:response regulator n=1 Tax=Sphingosinicella sp. BN140058 TaxID=1892855 RepID=UPI0013EE13D2|nr:response regulator [Sphingosinicella sp. BN140058]